jgi:8-oxo-dGTP pyrophosphatase MutT (NUDIX family)
MRRKWIAPSAAIARIADRLGRALAAPAVAYEPFVIADHVVGWVTPERAQRLTHWPQFFRRRDRALELAPSVDTPQARTEAIAAVARTLAAEGALSAWRDERYAVAASPGEEALFELERAAARYFGIHTFAAHANGLTGDEDRWRMWLARRSPGKAIDPGLLDNLVGGGIAAGSDAPATLVKEAWEEAGLAKPLSRHAQCAGSVDICRATSDGLQRETIYAYDLWLPADFAPANQDGEAVGHRLYVPEDVLAVLATDDITADASLVIVDFLIRHGHIPPGDPGFAALDALRRPPALHPASEQLKRL